MSRYERGKGLSRIERELVDTEAHRISIQDATLERHFVAFIAGAGGEYGHEAAEDLARIIARLRREESISFGGYVARLIQADAASRGW